MDRYKQRDYVKGLSLENMSGLRLGRITMTDTVENFPLLGETRWGFRFLFNPPSWSGGQLFNRDIIPDFHSDVPLVIAAGLEMIQLSLLLDRVPDVMGQSVQTSDYLPEISEDRLRVLQKRGTNYDLEYLYRVSNVNLLNTMDGQHTADIGVLLPNICMLTLGRQRYRGRLTQIVANHVMFSPDMVPVRTEVAITFQRIVQMSEEDFIEYAEGGGYDINSHRESLATDYGDITSSGGGSWDSESGASSSAGSGQKILTQDQMQMLALQVGFTASQAKIMSAIGMAESRGNAEVRNYNLSTGDDSYGLWQINMLGSMGADRRKAFGISSNEELKDPFINAKAAKIVYGWQGYRAWSVYKSGAHRAFL
jgi:hypothetical protein